VYRIDAKPSSRKIGKGQCVRELVRLTCAAEGRPTSSLNMFIAHGTPTSQSPLHDLLFSNVHVVYLRSVFGSDTCMAMDMFYTRVFVKS